MAEAALRHRTYYEGDDDGSVLRTLAAAGLLPPDLEVLKKGQRQAQGKDGMLKEIIPWVNPAGGAGRSAVAVRDVDDLDAAQVEKWFLDRLKDELPRAEPPIQVLSATPAGARVLLFRIEAPHVSHIGRVVGVAVGQPRGLAATEYGVVQFAIDDYVLLLAREQAVYEALDDFNAEGVPFDVALDKLRRVTDLMRENSVPIRHTKRLMHLLRAVTGFRAAPATFAERVITKALEVLGRDRVRDVFGPLIESLQEASRLLSS